MSIFRRRMKRVPQPLQPRTGTPPAIWWHDFGNGPEAFNGRAPINQPRWSAGQSPHFSTRLDDGKRKRRWHAPGGAYRFLGP